MKIKDLKEGGIVRVLHDGEEREGYVVNVGKDEVCINNGTQEFWYPFNELIPITLTEHELVHTLGFVKEVTPEGIKFKKGPFRVLVQEKTQFDVLEVWYREDRRHFNHALFVHELQAHHLDMTKMPLEKAVVH